ncbi:MAG: M23 family metallopeptidase [Caldilineaceae bacterium]|nr:M23 family metallopeptidase [Caldilineaceae bacterium]
MAREFESEYIYGIHEPGGENHMLAAGRPGWIVFTEEVGHDPSVRRGGDYRSYSDRGLGVIVRLNNGYYPNGTIPNSRQYSNFAQCCANFVANSQGCKIWIIGNEMNYRIERPLAVGATVAPPAAPQPTPSATPTSVAPPAVDEPTLLAGVRQWLQSWWQGITSTPPPTPAATAPVSPLPPIQLSPDDPYLRALPERFSAIHFPTPADAPRRADVESANAAADGTEVITPTLYAQCYQLCRNAIRRVAGHENDQVLIGAVAPWNNQTTYAGNERGDWIQYFKDILNLLGPTGVDGITLHTYTHQADPNLITSEQKMNPPFADRYFEFRTYQDFMNAIPTSMRSLPVYITETNQDVPWVNQNLAWVQRAYGEIDWWNRQPNTQKIRALVLYRWPAIDRWVIEGKGGVVEDFQLALQQGYSWSTASTSPTTFPLNSTVVTNAVINLRRTPGILAKANNDVLVQVPQGEQLTVVNAAPQQVDNLLWWQLRFPPAGQTPLTGWAAQSAPTGTALLRLADTSTGSNPADTFRIGERVRTTTVVRMRRSPGTLNKPSDDVLADVPANSAGTIAAGPRVADGLTWWQLRVASSGQTGWMAEKLATGQVLLVANPTVDPGPPPTTDKFKSGDRLTVLATARLRQTPGYANKAASDVLADILQGTTATVLGGPRTVDALTWWQVSTTNAQRSQVTGWMADSAPGGVPLLQIADSGGTAPLPSNALAAGDLVPVASSVRVRRTAGHLNKPDSDIVGDFAARATLYLMSGPQSVDGLSWWRVGGIMSNGNAVIGWAAEQAPNGVPLLARPALLAGTQIPDKATKSYLGLPFAGSFGISQLWGENPAVYRQFTYDGVALRGHNGIDFLTPMDTPLLAVDQGVVAEAVLNDPTGFGRYIKVNHSWGEAIYGHLNTIQVSAGQPVGRGAVIGTSGNTGFSSGPHLHFAIRINPYSRADGWGGCSDPLPYFDPTRIILPAYVTGGSGLRTPAPAQAPVGPSVETPLAENPGYAPDRPGVRRP